MKYHRWSLQEDGIYKCTHCGIGQNKKAHITACPPTAFEKLILEKLWYGNSRHQIQSFDGLKVLK